MCFSCYKQPPPFQAGVSAFLYDQNSKDLILRFKNGHDLSLLPLLAQWLFQQGEYLFVPNSILVPVPLHWTRLWRRRFNQSALLAWALSKKTALPYYPMLLKRIRKTRSQSKLNRWQRVKNVQNAFQVQPRYQSFIRGKTIILIDDVYTTGATLKTCGHTLLQAGAARVHILTLAKVITDHSFQHLEHSDAFG